MWKRIAVAAVTVLTVLAGSPAHAAHGKPPKTCEFSIPQMPDECLSQEMYDYVTGLQADNLALRTSVNVQIAEAYRLRTEMWQLGTDLQAARQATSIALGDLDAALEQIDRLDEIVAGLRVKVKVLKKRIKKLEAQLPRFVG